MTPPSDAVRRRALPTALWLAGAVLLGGLDLPARGLEAFRFAPFGVVAGLLGIVYLFALSTSGVVRRPPGWLDPLLLVYWVAATATLFRVLLPPPGLVQTGLAVAVAVAAGVIATRGDRDRAAIWLGIVAVTLAGLRFGLVPAFQARSGLPSWGPFQLAAAADSMRDFFVAYEPQRPAARLVHFGALVCYAAALRTQWNAPFERTEEEAEVTG